MESVVDEVCQDLKQRDIPFPSFQDLLRPVRSTLDGSYIKQQGGKPLSYCALTLLLVHPVDWHTTARSISGSISEVLNGNSSKSIELLSIGPSGSSLLFDFKQKPHSRLQIVNWSQQDQLLKSPAVADKNAIAIVGMGINLPKGSTLPELWDTLSKCLSAVEEVFMILSPFFRLV